MRSSSGLPFQLWLVLLVVAAIVHGQDKPVEPPAPVPTTAVQELVDEAASLPTTALPTRRSA
jgi:hypothetical protein